MGLGDIVCGKDGMDEFVQVILGGNGCRSLEIDRLNGNAAATAGGLGPEGLAPSVRRLFGGRWGLFVVEGTTLTRPAFNEHIHSVVNVNEEPRECQVASVRVGQEGTPWSTSTVCSNG